MHLLIIQDRPEERESIRLQLRRFQQDLQLTEVGNAEALRRALKQGAFDLVLTDYQLGWTDGLQVLHQVKAQFPNVPVVMLTASGSEEVAAEGMRAGLSAYLLKKHEERLPAVVQSSLERARLQEELNRSLRELQQSQAELERRVEKRTAELVQANERLSAEIAERQQAELAAEAERKRLEDVLERLPAYVALLSPDYHVPFANRFFRERFGESHGHRCYEYLFNRTEPCEKCETYKTLSEGCPQHWEWTGPDGHTYDINDLPFADADGSPLILEMGVDITKRKEAEKALQEAHDFLEVRVRERTSELTEANLMLQDQAEELREQQEEMEVQAEELLVSGQELRQTRDYLDSLLTYANAPIIVWGPNFRITRFNAAFERLTGRRSGEVLGRPLELLFPADRKEEAMEYIRRATTGEHWEVVEIPIQRVDGTVRTVLWNSATLYAEDGTTVVATIAQGQDITERKQIEEALAESELRYRTLFESMEEGFCVVEVLFDENDRPIDYRFLETNPAFEKQTDLVDAKGKCMRTLAPLHEEHWFQIYGDIALTGQSRRFQNRAEQLHRWYDVYAFRFGQPKNRQVAIFFSDITDRKRAEHEREQLLLQQEQLLAQVRADSETKAALLREVNHRVKNNLGAIIGLLYAQMGRPGTAVLPEYQAALGELTRRIEGLSVVHGLLSKTQWAPLSLDDLAEKVIGVTLQSAPAGQVTVKITPSSVRVSPDQAHTLALVLNELALNVGKYAGQGSPVQVVLEAIQEEGLVVLTVRDNGPGYPEEVLASQRSGVGLELLRGMVARNLRGQLALRNEAGAVTEIRFPLAVGSAGEGSS